MPCLNYCRSYLVSLSVTTHVLLRVDFSPNSKSNLFQNIREKKKSILHASAQTSLVVSYLRVKIKVSVKSLMGHITPLLPAHSALDALVSHLFLTCAKCN